MPITRDSLLTLEAYARERADFRARVLAHKKARTVHLGDHVTLAFEDELTIRYQIQEMLRIEKTFEEAGIQDELDAYNPLVPDGTNLKATMLIEYEDVEERRAALAQLRGVEDRVWIRVEGDDSVFAIAPFMRPETSMRHRSRTMMCGGSVTSAGVDIGPPGARAGYSSGLITRPVRAFG